MALLGGSTPNLGTTLTTGALDLAFQNCAILMKNPELCANTSLIGDITGSISGFLGNNLALPIAGFYYTSPSSIEYCRYTYSEYPFMNTKMVANSFVREPTSITIEGVRPITTSNSWLVNFMSTSSTIKMIEGYADQGGLFKLFTRWGTIDNLALEQFSLQTNTAEGDRDPGTFVFTFKRLLFIESDSASLVSSVLSAISDGWGNVKEAVGEAASGLSSTVSSLFDGSMLESLKETAGDVVDTVTDTVTGIVDTVTEEAGDLADKVKEGWNGQS